MLDIIILFVVIRMVVANIMKHVVTSGQSPKPDASGRPVAPGNPGRPGHSNDGRNVYRQSGTRQAHIPGAGQGGMFPANQGSVVDRHAAQAEGFSIEYQGGSSFEGMGQEGLKNTPYDGSRAVKLEVLSSDAKRHSLSFSRHAVINGIIMSELLQPPKALRRRRTY